MNVDAAERETSGDEAVREILLRSLDRSPKTRWQLAELLRGKGVPGPQASRLLDRLEAARLIDDGAFAQMWVQSRHFGKGLARRVLRQELLARGVAPEDTDRALEVVSDEDERVAAKKLVKRRLAALRGLDDASRRRRLTGMLARRGYSNNVTQSVLRECAQVSTGELRDE